MEKAADPAGTSPGRPRAFDVDAALGRAMEVFWREGYEGASLADLTRAMGINRPSLYATFGNKEALFRKAMDRYAEGPGSHVQDALTEPTARGVAERFLNGTADMVTCPNSPAGCMAVQGALACSAAAESVRQELIARRIAGENGLRERLERAKAEGDLPSDSDPAELARFLTAVSQGMAVEATSGATREELEGVVRTAMRAWPGST